MFGKKDKFWGSSGKQSHWSWGDVGQTVPEAASNHRKLTISKWCNST